MKLLQRMKDGGPESPVVGYFLVEIKSLFSVVLLHFGGTREAYHSHAFNAVTLWLKGKVKEYTLNKGWQYWYAGHLKYTARNTFHKVDPLEDTWALSFRGPWTKTWQEYWPAEDKLVTLTHGRRVVN